MSSCSALPGDRMKAYEETWELAEGSETDEYCLRRGHVLGIDIKGGSYGDEVVTTDSGVYGPTLERARLIVQAPAMARLLLNIADFGDFNEESIRDVLRAAGVLP